MYDSKSSLSRLRKQHFLKLKDLAKILAIDSGNLSRAESGKLNNAKAVLGYYILFGLPLQEGIEQVLECSMEQLMDRSFQLIENISHEPVSIKNELRAESLHQVITRLNEMKESV